MRPTPRALLAPLLFLATAAAADEAADERAFVEGGIYDKPFMTTLGQRLSLGGYAEANARYERAEGAIEEITFELERFNLFGFAAVSDRVRMAAEIEIEEGGEELTIELAVVDFEIHQALSFRAGVLLSPLGRFNLAHDGPANELVDRPLVSTRIIPTTFSEPGMGFYGALFPSARSRLTYEVYAVNGLSEGVITADGDGTRIPAGKRNWEDQNGRPALVSRVAVSPDPALEIGASIHHGAYNVFEVEGVRVDDTRTLTITALDFDAERGRLRLTGEFASAAIDIPRGLSGLLASSQRGVYAELAVVAWEGFVSSLPRSALRGVVRLDVVDMNADIHGDSERRLALGTSFRPTPDTVFKLSWQRSWRTDPFDARGHAAAFLFSVASYF